MPLPIPKRLNLNSRGWQPIDNSCTKINPVGAELHQASNFKKNFVLGYINLQQSAIILQPSTFKKYYLFFNTTIDGLGGFCIPSPKK
jgi:hypothetical protein